MTQLHPTFFHSSNAKCCWSSSRGPSVAKNYRTLVQHTPQSGALASLKRLKTQWKATAQGSNGDKMGLKCFMGGEQISPTILLMWKLMGEAFRSLKIWPQRSKVKFFCAGIIDVGLGMVAVGGCRVPVCHENLETHVCWTQSGCGGRRTVPSLWLVYFTIVLIYTSKVPNWVWKEGNVIETYILGSSEHIFRVVFTTQQRLIFNNAVHLRALLLKVNCGRLICLV